MLNLINLRQVFFTGSEAFNKIKKAMLHYFYIHAISHCIHNVLFATMQCCLCYFSHFTVHQPTLWMYPIYSIILTTHSRHQDICVKDKESFLKYSRFLKTFIIHGCFQERTSTFSSIYSYNKLLFSSQLLAWTLGNWLHVIESNFSEKSSKKGTDERPLSYFVHT